MWLRVLLICACAWAAAASPAAGQVTLTGFGADRNTDFADDVVVLPDGRIVTAGTVDWDFGPAGIGLARYLPSGELDGSFGDAGRVVTRPTYMTGRALARQPDGRLLVAGGACDGDTCDVAVTRYTEAGALDGSFGAGGTARVRFPCGDGPPRSNALDLALEPGGGIVAVGDACHPEGGSGPVVARLEPDGSLDPSFGDGGRVILDVRPFNGVARATAIDGDGRIVVAGEVEDNDAPAFVARLAPGGAPDPSFDGDGMRRLAPVPDSAAPAEVGVLGDRRIVFAGPAVIGGVPDGWFVGRLRPDGSDDASFDGDGRALLRGRTNLADLGMHLAPDGTATLTGQRYEEGRGSHIGVTRFTPAGALDPSFGGGGVMLIPAEEESMGRAVAAGPGGSLAIAGWAGSQEARYTFALARVPGEPTVAPPPPDTAPADPPLRIAVRSRGRVRLRRNGSFRLALGPFTEQVTGRVEMLLGPRRFARRGFAARRGQSVRVRLRATRRVRRLAERRRGVRVVARLSARDVRARYAARRFTFRLYG